MVCRSYPQTKVYPLRRLLIGLSRRAQVLPSQLYVRGVYCENREMVAWGGYGDIFRGLFQGEEVALKRLRVFRNDVSAQKAGYNIYTIFYSQAKFEGRTFFENPSSGAPWHTLMSNLSSASIKRLSRLIFVWSHHGCSTEIFWNVYDF